MKILVTGGNGQLGRALQKYLVGHELLIFDLPEFDITDGETVEKHLVEFQPDLVFNAAAYTGVDGAESNKEDAFRVNAEGPKVLAKATAKKNIPLIHISTDYIFDGRKTEPYVEDDKPHPLSVYGQSKLDGENAVRQFNPHHFIVRTAWLYYVEGKNFPKTMISLANNAEVKVVSDQVGSPTYAPHLVLGLGKLIERGGFGTYHMAGTGQTSWFGLAKFLYEKMGFKTVIRPVKTSEFPRAAKRPPYSVLGTIRKPEILLPPWEDGVSEFVEHYSELSAKA